MGTYQQEQCTELRILGRGPLAQTLVIELNNKLYAPLHDQNGNIAALIDAESGKLQETYSYTAFGELLFTPHKNHWLVAGKRYDPETGFIYFGKRYYDPTTGCWLTPDPLGFADGWNLYAYLRNNPFRYYDPDGQCVVVLMVPVVAIALGAGTIVIETVTLTAITQAVIVAVLGAVVYQTNTWYDNRYCSEVMEEESKNEKERKDFEKKKKPRTEPRNLEEQLALEEAKGGAGERIMEGKTKDQRYPQDQWEKKQHIHYGSEGSKINIHYWEEKNTSHKEGFKFKDY